MSNNAANNPSFERIILNLPHESSLAIPLLRDFASPPGVILRQRLDRRYRRLCFVQEELKALSEKSPGSQKRAQVQGTVQGQVQGTVQGQVQGTVQGTVSFEDFVFSNMDFSRYAKIPQADFDFYLQSIPDFDHRFFTKNFKIDPVETQALIQKAYTKIDAYYCLARPNPLILSIMRTLETSLESVPLVQEEEILNELNILYAFLKAGCSPQETPAGLKDQGFPPAAWPSQKTFSFETVSPFFDFILSRLDGLCVTHHDGNETKLFINPQGSLAGTFMPGGKPWTLTLVESRE